MWHQTIAWLDPVMAADRLRLLPGLAFLDSAMPHDLLGRYSFVAADPFGQFRVDQNGAFWQGQPLNDHPVAALRQKLRDYHTPAIADLPPFQGGAIGMIGYDFACWLEDLPRLPDAGGDEVFFNFYDVVLAWDFQTQTCHLFSSGWPEDDFSARQARARARQQQFLDLLQCDGGDGEAVTAAMPVLEWQANFDRAAFMAGVETVKNYILDGDIYQANLARQMVAAWPDELSPWAFYQSLRHHNPAPFGAYLVAGDRVIASSSPERFLRLDGDHAETRPIKGTIRRVDDLAEDARRAEMLKNSEKDRAENIMIVDLLRNDFSRLCQPESVQVPMLCGLESYAGLHHLVSVVTGTLAPGRDGLDLIAACFPGGSITGAPKIRAMQIIAEIENHARGAYCGAIGWIGFDGNLDLNIAIRTVVFENNQVMFHSGGGITALSDAAAEFDEVLTKSRRIIDAFAAGGSSDGSRAQKP